MSPLPQPPQPDSYWRGQQQHFSALLTHRLEAAWLGATHGGQFGDSAWMARTPADLHEAPHTAGQALASLLTAGKAVSGWGSGSETFPSHTVGTII